MSPGPATGGHARETPPATVCDQPQAVCEQKQPSEAVGNHKVVKRMLSDPSDREDVVVKRRRLFQETMGELRSGIVGAADGGKWYIALNELCPTRGVRRAACNTCVWGPHTLQNMEHGPTGDSHSSTAHVPLIHRKHTVNMPLIATNSH